MAEVHHFAYGWLNPVLAYALSFAGALIGLSCAARARAARTTARRSRWLVLAAVAIGGAGIWLMRFMAMLGFDVPGSTVRYDPWLTALSLVLAVGAVCVGLLVAANGRPSVLKVLGGGMLTGCGLVATHYTGMVATRVAGRIEYDTELAGASVGVAIVTATVALWFAVTVRRSRYLVGAALVMATAVCGTHYTGMAATRVRLYPTGPDTLPGIDPIMLIVPVTLLTGLTLIGGAFSALQAMTEEEFGIWPQVLVEPAPQRHTGRG